MGTRVVRSRHGLIAGCVGAFVVAAVCILPAVAPAYADSSNGSPSLQLTTDPPGTVHMLSPGESALWQVGVTTQAVSLTSLLGQLQLSGSMASLSTSAAGAPVTIELRSCRQAWASGSCGQGAFTILAATPLGDVDGANRNLTDPSLSIPANVYLQATVTMPANASQSLQGTSADAQLKVTATGEAAEGQNTLPNDLADTGLRVTSYAALGALAVAIGIILAALARRRRSSDA